MKKRELARHKAAARPPRQKLIAFAGLGVVLASLILLVSRHAVTIKATTLHPASADAAPAAIKANFGPTVANTAPAPAASPAGMAWIPGGEFSMGAQDASDMNEVGMNATRDSRPIHRVYVDGFFMDKTDVTNAQFARFVKAAGYVTVAERKPRQEDYPTAPPENLVAGSVVFSPPNHPVQLNDHFQ